MTTQTPLMVMVLPDVGVTPGPLWATLVVAAMSDRLDSHDHTTGNGAKVRAAGLDIDGNVNFNTNALLNLLIATFNNNSTRDTTAGNLQVYQSDLVFRNHSGINVPITSGSALAVPGAGAITQKSITDPYTVVTADAQRVLEMPTNLSASAITLPAASVASFWVVIKDVSGNASSNNIVITVDNPGAETIDGGTSYTINTDYGFVALINDGSTNWSIVG